MASAHIFRLLQHCLNKEDGFLDTFPFLSASSNSVESLSKERRASSHIDELAEWDAEKKKCNSGGDNGNHNERDSSVLYSIENSCAKDASTLQANTGDTVGFNGVNNSQSWDSRNDVEHEVDHHRIMSLWNEDD